MSDSKPVPAILRRPQRVRYLKLIAVFKMMKGALLLVLGISLLFLNSRARWMDSISDWAQDELLLVHNKSALYLLNKLQEVLAGGHLHGTGLLALFYSGVLFTEGIGVYLQFRWAEMLMVFATAALIPLEVRHLWHKPGVVAVFVLAVNCFIVWFLYRVLKKQPDQDVAPTEREVVETR